MIIKIKVRPNAGVNEVIAGEILVVKVKAVPEDGKANEAVRKLLAKYYNVPISSVIVKNPRSRTKLVEIRGV